MDEIAHSAVCRAFGKVNLTLSILGRRPDGYHEVSTLMAPVDLCDVLTFTRKERGVSVVCPSLPDLPPEKNLVFKAAEAMFAAVGRPFGLDILLEKRIPPGSGMGGGSSDAAAALIEIDRMLPGEARLDRARFHQVAAGIGADVPFFLGCDSRPPLWQAALCTGTGGEVEPIDGARLDAFWLVIAFPQFEVSTAQAYADWNAGAATSLRGTGRSREALAMSALLSGDPARLAAGLANDLEAPVSKRYPEIPALKRRLVDCGALGASMTGSGSAVFGVCKSAEHAALVKSRFEDFGGPGHSRAIVTRLGV